MTANDDDALLYGVKHIASHLKLSTRQVAHLIAKGHLPTFKLGGIICTTKSGLAEHFGSLIRASTTPETENTQ